MLRVSFHFNAGPEPKLTKIFSYFHGKVSRKEADKLLLNSNFGRGTFLIRHPDQNKPGYSLSIKTKNNDGSFSVKHYKINSEGDKCWIAKNDIHVNMDVLVNHYKGWYYSYFPY